MENKIATDDVVFTQRQIQHVGKHKERTTLYDTYKDRLLEIINEPDYIFGDKDKETLWVIKELDKRIRLFLKLNTSPKSDYKNSILSMQELGNKKLKQYKNTKKILYKK
jgi:hypothetical protein